MPQDRLTDADLLMLGRFNTPTVYNGWEQITRCDTAREGFNLEATHDFMPQMGTLVGRAVTVVCEPSKRKHKTNHPNAPAEYLAYVASVPGPKVVVVQDLDKPAAVGSFWGEVNSSAHHALGCVGTITDGAVRDVDEMTAVGFHAIARRTCVGHAHSTPVRWNCSVEVFGCAVRPGQLIHADRHGFLAIPAADEARLLEAVAFMDANECRTVIAAARSSAGLSVDEVLRRLGEARAQFARAAREKFSRPGE